MRFSLLSSLLFALFLSSPTSAGPIKRQAPNTAFANNVPQMTASYNVTFNLLPISKAVALSLLPKDPSGNPLYSLITPTGLPSGFLAADQHLIYINSGYQYEIRQGVITVNELSVSFGSFPCLFPFGLPLTACLFLLSLFFRLPMSTFPSSTF